MHSSRMRTARSLLYSGVSVQVGLCPAGGGLSWRSLSRKPSPMDGIGMTDASKNIALPQTSLRAVTRKISGNLEWLRHYRVCGAGHWQ